MTNEVKTVTTKELVQAFEGKHINVSYNDLYGIVISMMGGTFELEDEKLWIVTRDKQNNATGSVCICEDSIQQIEKDEDAYYIVANFDMPYIEIEECAPELLEKLRSGV